MKRVVGKNGLPMGRNHGEKCDGFGSERGKMRQVLGHVFIDAKSQDQSQEEPESKPPGRGRPGSKQPPDPLFGAPDDPVGGWLFPKSTGTGSCRLQTAS